MWNEILPDSFVYFKPKDILSGDFYWIEQKDDLIFIAVADCTGHGVPGALISIVNYNLLNKAVLEMELSDPADILNAVNNWLTISLHQTLSRQMTSSSTPAAVVDKTAEQLATVQLDQDGKPLTKNALKKLEKEREKAKKKVGPLRGNYRNVSL